ncbi:DUF6366 family protein [Halobacillus salinus]|uniref:DUF6366 family protein n=1 Tax=Halobacillus salinus TaxID=192814 RepID=UPI0009A7CFC1|nr:DUF6366 family protein [Halobacillus salinus]
MTGKETPEQKRERLEQLEQNKSGAIKDAMDQGETGSMSALTRGITGKTAAVVIGAIVLFLLIVLLL